MAESVVISGAVEGPVDEAVLRRLLQDSGALPGTIYGKMGKSRLVQKIGAYNHAARLGPWVILVDLDRDAECVALLRNRLLPAPEPALCFRIAVRAVESWLLADRERFASFFGVVLSKIPQHPEGLLDPKRSVVELARSSRRKEIRRDLVPRPESGRVVGPAYTSRMVEYIESLEEGWRPAVAAEGSESLRRCLSCVQRLVQRKR